MKEFSEIAVGAGKITDSFYQTFEDGKFQPTEITNFVDDVFAGIAAGEDAGQAWPELQVMTNEEKQTALKGFSDQLSHVPAEDREDITGIFNGMTSVVRLVARRAYQKGLEDGQAIATKQL